MLKVDMYTDGSCLKNPDGPGGYGVIVRYEKNGKLYEKKMSSGYENTTNNRMEVTAVIKGLELMPANSEIIVHSDSKYLVDAITKNWVKKWESLNWDRGVNGGPVKNVDLWKDLLKAMQSHKVKFEWVKGHNGNPLNELCDKMAVEAAKTQKAFYYEGYVKENNCGNEIEEKLRKRKNIHIDFSQVNWKESDVEKEIKKNSTFIIIPFGSYDGGESKTGKYTILIMYDAFHKIYRNSVNNCKSVNEVVLKGILETLDRIRYKKKEIVIISAMALGFSNPVKSANKEMISRICEMADAMECRIKVLEIKNGMKGLKKIFRDYEALS